MHMYSLLQIVVQKIATIIDSYDLINKNRNLIIRCLNTIRNQQIISTTRVVSYILNLLFHIINYDFT
jgi:hypothetical protein